MSNSNMVSYTKISPSSNPRNHNIDKITIHHMSGNLSIESCGEWFSRESTRASSNYGIGSDGRVGMYVEEKRRAWTSSDRDNDMRAVTIEVANDEIGGNWHVSDKALATLIDLCVDICQRNGIEKLNFTGDASGNLTMHKWFANTDCPGPYLESKFPYIAEEVNKRLGVESAPVVPDCDTAPVKPKRLEGLPLLKLGAKGETVRALQILLIGNGISCGKHGADGEYGPDTENAVECLQEEMNDQGIPLKIDGECGPETWAAAVGLR